MRGLRETLEHTPIALLREMAHFWEVPDAEEAGRPSLVNGLLDQMGQPEVVARALKHLDRAERDALRAVLAAGGRIQAPALTRAYGRLRPPHLAPADPTELNPTERLHRKGFLFRSFSAWEDWSGPAFFVPSELWPHLPRVPQATPTDQLQTLQGEEVTPRPADRALHRDMACLLALFRREAHAVAEDGSWPADLQGPLDDLLAPDHPAYVNFLLHLARQARLLAPDIEGRLRPTAEGGQWLRAAPSLRAQVLFLAWRDHPTWDDLAAVPELLVERSWPADLAAPRERVLRHLSACPAETWLALPSWVRTVEASDPDFLCPSGAAGRPRVRRRKTGAALSGAKAWNDVEGRYLRFLITGPLHWLGLVDLGQGPGPTQETIFRLAPLGSALLHPEAGLPEQTDEPVIVEGTFEVWAPAEASPHIVFVLEFWAERAQQDHMSRYRLTRQAVHQALQRGKRVDRLLESLAGYGRGEVPQNVAYTLQEWAAAYGRIRLHRPLLLTAEDAVLLEEVLADSQVDEACGERLSPTTAAVETGQVSALVDRLCQLGHLPEVEKGILPEGEQFPLVLTRGQGTALLSLLWAWLETYGKGKPGQALSELADTLTQRLPPALLAKARRQKKRWLQAWEAEGDEASF